MTAYIVALQTNFSSICACRKSLHMCMKPRFGRSAVILSELDVSRRRGTYRSALHGLVIYLVSPCSGCIWTSAVFGVLVVLY